MAVVGSEAAAPLGGVRGLSGPCMPTVFAHSPRILGNNIPHSLRLFVDKENTGELVRVATVFCVHRYTYGTTLIKNSRSNPAKDEQSWLSAAGLVWQNFFGSFRAKNFGKTKDKLNLMPFLLLLPRLSTRPSSSATGLKRRGEARKIVWLPSHFLVCFTLVVKWRQNCCKMNDPRWGLVSWLGLA